VIFVTVGTHEQQFNRLIKYIDELKGSGEIKDEVIIQTGYCSYEIKHCQGYKFLPYKEMVSNVAEARVVITHGGPSSIIMPLQIRKIPIVVPRQKQFDEHVNNHQVEFVKAFYGRQGNIIPVYEIEKMCETIRDYESIIEGISKEILSNNEKFNEKLSGIINEIFNKK
jgi:UDP-N-acetylglucosamine transferase subunit ALG13